MALPAIAPMLGRLFAGGARGGLFGDLIGGMLGGKGKGASGPPPLPAGPPPLQSDPDFFVKNEAWKKKNAARKKWEKNGGGQESDDGGAGSLAGTTGKVGATVGMIKSIDPIGPLRDKIAGLGKDAVKGTLGITLFSKAFKTAYATLPIDQVKAFGNEIAHMVAMFNPAAVTRWTYAVDTVTATLGKSLLPILDATTKWVRKFADGLAGTLPIFQPVIDAFARFINSEANRIPELFARLGPVLTHAADALVKMLDYWSKALDVFFETFKDVFDFTGAKVLFDFMLMGAEAMMALVTATGKAIAFIKGMAQALLDILGIHPKINYGGKNRFNPDAKGAPPVRHVSVDSVKSFSDKAFEKSAQMSVLDPNAKAEDPLKQISTTASEIKNATAAGFAMVKDIAADIKNLYNIVRGLAEKTGGVINSVTDPISNLPSKVAGVAGSIAGISPIGMAGGALGISGKDILGSLGGLSPLANLFSSNNNTASSSSGTNNFNQQAPPTNQTGGNGGNGGWFNRAIDGAVAANNTTRSDITTTNNKNSETVTNFFGGKGDATTVNTNNGINYNTAVAPLPTPVQATTVNQANNATKNQIVGGDVFGGDTTTTRNTTNTTTTLGGVTSADFDKVVKKMTDLEGIFRKALLRS